MAHQNIIIKGINTNNIEITICFSYPPSCNTYSSLDSIELSISIPQKDWYKLTWFQLNITDRVCLENIYIQDIVKINTKEIQSMIILNYGNNFVKENFDDLICFYPKIPDSKAIIVFSPAFFYQSRPIGFQLFLRLSFLAVLIILTLILAKQASTQRLLLFTIALFLASLPLKTDYTNYTMGLMSFTMIIVFIRDKSRRFNWQPVFFVLCGMYLMNVAGLFYTGDLNLGVRRLDTLVVLVMFPVIFSMIQFPKQNVMLILRFFVWAAIAFCTFGLFSYAAIVPGLTWDMVFADSKLYAPLLMMWPAHWHPSFDCTILLMAVPIALYLRYQDGKIITFVEMLLGVILPIVFTILAGARIGMVAVPVLLGLAYLFYCRFQPIYKWGLVAAGIVAVGLLLYQFPKADDRFVDPARVDLRETAMSAIEEKPVFGWGTGYVKPLIRSEERAHRLGIETPYPFAQFHNQYFEDMVQFGIPGILVLLALIGWALWLGISKKDYLLLSLLVIYLLFFWTESVMYNAKGVVPFVFWISFLVATQNIRLKKKNQQNSHDHRI